MWKNYRLPILTVLSVLFVDQFIKLYIKSHYPLGEVKRVLGDWFILHFTENPGMAFGYEFGGDYGKLALSLFRILAVVAGVFYIRYIVKRKESRGFIICVALVLAGALGNILDSAFYGLLFDRGMTFDPVLNEYMGYSGVADMSGPGYASFLHGCVVDMFYFPIWTGTLPDWVPIWGGEEVQFFRPIFNFADASITVGIATILIFQKRFFRKQQEVPLTEERPDEAR